MALISLFLSAGSCIGRSLKILKQSSKASRGPSSNYFKAESKLIKSLQRKALLNSKCNSIANGSGDPGLDGAFLRGLLNPRRKWLKDGSQASPKPKGGHVGPGLGRWGRQRDFRRKNNPERSLILNENEPF